MSSLPPQDPSSPGAIAGATFPAARKGFDPAAVREFLRQVSQELSRAQHERDRLGRELDEAREATRRATPELMDEATVAAKLGEEAARVLATAHEAAGQIRTRAEETSARLLRDAELEAARQRGEAEVEAARRLREADEQAEADVEGAKSEGREMVAEARAIRERIFNDLTQRRELARRQIDALHGGRVRMMESLRSARVELEAILEELEAQAPYEEDDEDEEELPSFLGSATARVPTVESENEGVVLGEMDVPAAIVARLIEPAEVRNAPADPDDDVPGAEVVQLTVVTSEIEVVEDDAGDADDEDRPTVDDVFARLRASSSETVARDVLESDVVEDTPTAPTADLGAPEVEPPIAAAPETEAPEPEGTAVLPAGMEALARRQKALAPVRTALSRHLKRVLADEQNEVLDRLRQRGATTAVDAVLAPVSVHAGTYREAAEDHLWAAAEAGARALSDLDGEELVAALEQRSVLDRCLDTVESELVVPLRARLTENLEAAGDPAEAASLLRAAYREWKGRIDELGEDLVRTAYGRASYAVLAPGARMCWVLDPSGPDCPDAEDNVLAGAVPAGEPFPTGHRYAPAYRGCRCLLVPDPG